MILNYRRIAGQRAKSFGALFESMFLGACRRTGVAVTRFPDGCKRVAMNKLIQVKTPCDWICTFQGRTALIDTKTVQSTSFAYSAIASHQVHEMLHHEIAGAIAGYLIWLRKSDDIIFVRAQALERIYLSTQIGSISISHDRVKLIGKGSGFDPRTIFDGKE